MMVWTDVFGSGSSVLGYSGAVIVALAYLLNQRGKLPSHEWRFPAMNLAGSLLILVSLTYRLNPPSVLIEVFWSAISAYGVQRNLRAARQTSA